MTSFCAFVFLSNDTFVGCTLKLCAQAGAQENRTMAISRMKGGTGRWPVFSTGHARVSLFDMLF